MNRLYRRHYKRIVTSLNGMWRFRTDPDRKGISEAWFRRLPEDSAGILVPSCWNMLPGLSRYQGAAWFSTVFHSSCGTAKLMFHAVTGQAEIYVDGRHVGSHYGGFTGFGFTIRDMAPGEHTLAVFVDNTSNMVDTIPLASVDWRHYGGMIRGVEWMELSGLWIDSCKVDYDLDIPGRSAAVRFDLVLEAADAEAYADTLNIYIRNKLVHSGPVIVSGRTEIQVDGIALDDLELWDVGQPNLYEVRVETSTDDLIERIGFREIKAEGGRIVLNGKPMFLKGVNRHEDHPDWGFAIPAAIMQQDIRLIKSIGCNSIRGSHYPNAELFLDMCDEEGLLFWEEIPMWQYFEAQLVNPLVKERGLAMLAEMVERDYHHPSVIIWGLHNEIDTRIGPAFDMTKAFADETRRMDPRRLIAYASSYPLEDICFSVADLICVNKYFEWYEGVKEDWVGFLGDLKDKRKRDGLENKPILISEFGVEAIYGVSSMEKEKWSEDYQETYLTYTLELFLRDADLSGAFIWQYSDTLSDDRIDRSLLRPRGYNNKGIVNENRKPKRAFHAVGQLFHSSGEMQP